MLSFCIVIPKLRGNRNAGALCASIGIAMRQVGSASIQFKNTSQTIQTCVLTTHIIYRFGAWTFQAKFVPALQVPTVSRGLLENFFHMLMTWSGTPRLAPIKAGPRLEEIPEKVVRDLSSDQKYLRLAIQYSAKEYPDRCQGNV